MNITQIEEIVKKLAAGVIANQVNKGEFIYQLMAAYAHHKTTIGRIKSGERNLASYECYNMNTQKFENLIHTVFKDVCIDVEIADSHGVMCKPRE